VEYVGQNPTTLMGAELKENSTIENGDFFVTTRGNAVALCGGTQYKMVKGVDELASFLDENPQTPLSLSDFDTEDLENELISRGVSVGTVTDDETKMPDDGVSGDGVTDPVVSDEETDAEAQAKADAEAQAKADAEAPLREATKENVMDLSLKEVKAACKKYKITIGAKKQDELIALLLPYLQ